MTINDLKIDIIASISELSDISLLKEIKKTISSSSLLNKKNSDAIWKGAELEIRQGVSFDQLMEEQEYKKISFAEFTEETLDEEWEVSLDLLLSNAN